MTPFNIHLRNERLPDAFYFVPVHEADADTRELLGVCLDWDVAIDYARDALKHLLEIGTRDVTIEQFDIHGRRIDDADFGA